MQRRERRRAFGWAARHYNHRLFGDETRIGRCARHPITSNIAFKRTGGTVHASGLMQCGSVHACPPCAAKIRYRKAEEIDQQAKQHLEAGGGLVFLTVTLPHDLSDRLDRLWGVVAKAWSSIITGKQYYGNDKEQGAQERFGIIGFIRAFDLTHGENGWHPHLHILIFLEKPVNELDDEFWELTSWFRHRWTVRIKNLLGRDVHREIGVQTQSVKNASGVGTYVSKVNLELARSDLKKGRAYGSRSPFQILEDAIDNDLPSDRGLWVEYVKASKGRRVITTSKNVAALYPLGDELTDEEIANEEQEGQTELLIDRSIWTYLLANHQHVINQLIDAQQKHGASKVFRTLKPFCRWAVFDNSGEIPLIKPNNKQ